MAVSPPQQFGASVNRHTPKNAIGRITPTGEVTEYPVNLGPPMGITAGPDGNMWFTEPGADRSRRSTRGQDRADHP